MVPFLISSTLFIRASCNNVAATAKLCFTNFNSSSVPAHVEMMGFLGIGNNPMVGCTVAVAVDVAQALSK